MKNKYINISCVDKELSTNPSWNIHAKSLLDVCDINHSGVEDYTVNISREYQVKKVDNAKGINSK